MPLLPSISMELFLNNVPSFHSLCKQETMRRSTGTQTRMLRKLLQFAREMAMVLNSEEHHPGSPQ
jgi:hypothetical protein